MRDSVLTSVGLPLALFLIMLGMGLSLVPDDFRRVFREPRAALVGLGNQLVLLPLVAFALTYVFHVSPTIAVGVMLLAFCPGGVTSNLITHVSKGDTALSISLTAVTSLVTVLTIPPLLSWVLHHFLGDADPVRLPVLKTVGQIFGITVLPVSLGMVIRRFRPAFATMMDRPMRIASTVVFVLLVGGIIVSSLDLLQEHFFALAGVTLALNVCTMALGYAAGRLARLDLRQTITVMIESGIQNGTLAIVIATAILHRGDLGLPAGVYSLLMFATGGVMMVTFGLRKTPAAA